MEKYYLTKLDSSVGPDSLSKVRLVEVEQQAELPPSFGLVRLSLEEGGKQRGQFAVGHQIKLTALNWKRSANELEKNGGINVVEFEEKRVELTCAKVVDFDARSRISLETSHLDCVLLCEDGTLFAIQFADRCAKHLSAIHLDSYKTQTSHNNTAIQCHLRNDNEIGQRGSYVYVLSVRCYYLYKLTASSEQLELVNVYPSAQSPDCHFVNLLVLEANQQTVILELEDSSMRVINQNNCLATFKLPELYGPTYGPKLILKASSDCEFTILNSIGTKLVAYTLVLRGETEKDDPDQLLVREPNFELEENWHLDLDEIDCVRSLEIDEESKESCCLCPIWSPLEPDGPKFLAIMFKHHMLVYGFEQPSALSFSTLYDQSFLEVAATSEGGDQKTLEFRRFHVDTKARPRLLHNFKLIGAQPTDCLFNSLFLTTRIRLLEARHFPRLNLLVAIASFGHLLAFRFTSDRIVTNEDRQLGQLLVKLIRGGSLLRGPISQIEQDSSALREDIRRLESNSIDGNDLNENLNRMLTVELNQSNEFGSLYHLNIYLPNLIQVSSLIVASTVNSHILEPTSSRIKSIEIDNQCATTLQADGSKPMVLSDDGLGGDRISQHKTDINLEVQLQAWACIELNDEPESFTLKIPIFIMDGQYGELKLIYILNTPESMAQIITRSTIRRDKTNWPTLNPSSYSNCLQIKPLISYQETDLFPDQGQLCPIVTMGGFADGNKMLSWLSQCLDTPTGREAQFKSLFTKCYLKYCLDGDSISFVSDDLIALELVKKHILRLATNESVELELSHQRPSIENLRHLIDLQLKNLAITDPIIASAQNRTKDFLLQSLASEIDTSGLATEMQVQRHLLMDQLANDVEKLFEDRDESSSMLVAEDESKFTVQVNMVFGYIIDTLVDFDRLYGLKVSSTVMLAMRSKLMLLLPIDKLADRRPLVDKILRDWNECRKIE